MKTGGKVSERIASRGRHILLIGLTTAIALILTVVSLEILSAIVLTLRYGSFAFPGERLLAERNAYVNQATQQQDCSYGESIVIHPFLAFGQSKHGPCGVSYANSKTLIGREFPDRPESGTGIVLVTGGSVAAQFVGFDSTQPSPLEETLNREFAGGAYERFVVLNGGHGAWKQPQQYILFGLHADVLAGVITLDGFNEHYMVGSSFRFEFPSDNFFGVIGRFDSRSLSDARTQAARRLEANVRNAMADHVIFRLSQTAYLLGDTARARLRRHAEKQSILRGSAHGDWVQDTYDEMFAFHSEMSEEERRHWQLDQYAKYVRLMHAGAQEMGVKSLFVVQPTPAFGKPLTDEEQVYARATNVDSYRALTERLLRLREEQGIPVHALLDVFGGHAEPIYVDAIHVNAHGNELMAEAVADLIESEWGWPRSSGPPSEPSRSVQP